MTYKNSNFPLWAQKLNINSGYENVQGLPWFETNELSPNGTMIPYTGTEKESLINYKNQKYFEGSSARAAKLNKENKLTSKQVAQRNMLRRADESVPEYTKPIFNIDVKKENTNFEKVKKLKPDYGEMPGFKRPLDSKGKKQGYWDADEKSDFWKTDAGYEKAVQTWGRDGGTLPQFVKKPIKKELDIEAIKKFFSMGS